MDNNKTRRLSEKAIQEFRDIYQEEFDELLTDDQAAAMSLNVLKFFKLLADELPSDRQGGIRVSEQEFNALKHAHQCLFHENKQPTTRSVAQAIGRTSSRSGAKMIKHLLKRGLLWNDGNWKVTMQEGYCEIWECCK